MQRCFMVCTVHSKTVTTTTTTEEEEEQQEEEARNGKQSGGVMEFLSTCSSAPSSEKAEGSSGPMEQRCEKSCGTTWRIF